MSTRGPASCPLSPGCPCRRDQQERRRGIAPGKEHKCEAEQGPRKVLQREGRGRQKQQCSDQVRRRWEGRGGLGPESHGWECKMSAATEDPVVPQQGCGGLPSTHPRVQEGRRGRRGGEGSRVCPLFTAARKVSLGCAGYPPPKGVCVSIGSGSTLTPAVWSSRSAHPPGERPARGRESASCFPKGTEAGAAAGTEHPSCHGCPDAISGKAQL